MTVITVERVEEKDTTETGHTGPAAEIWAFVPLLVSVELKATL
jgi:hypothetical protein